MKSEGIPTKILLPHVQNATRLYTQKAVGLKLQEGTESDYSLKRWKAKFT
jgi:hypothetical protein